MRELTDETLERYAREFARSYCRRWRDFKDFDDLAQEIACFLLERRELWNEPAQNVRAAVNCYLIDLYRKKNGSRRKYARRVSPLTEETAANLRDDRNELELIERRELLASFIERAIRETNSEKFKYLINLHLSGMSSSEIGAVVGISPRSVRRKLQAFRARLNELIKGFKNEY